MGGYVKGNHLITMPSKTLETDPVPEKRSKTFGFPEFDWDKFTWGELFLLEDKFPSFPEGGPPRIEEASMRDEFYNGK